MKRIIILLLLLVGCTKTPKAPPPKIVDEYYTYGEFSLYKDPKMDHLAISSKFCVYDLGASYEDWEKMANAILARVKEARTASSVQKTK